MKMKNTICNVIIALPMFLVGVNPSLASTDLNPIELKSPLATLEVGVTTPVFSSVATDQSDEVPYLLAARGDDDDEKCRWLGKCLDS
jgi:hypothetical protein